jgi:hypothetical protein
VKGGRTQRGSVGPSLTGRYEASTADDTRHRTAASFWNKAEASPSQPDQMTGVAATNGRLRMRRPDQLVLWSSAQQFGGNPMEGNPAYLTARAAEESAFAMKAMDPQKRAEHRRMAERYRNLATTIRGRQSNETPRPARATAGDKLRRSPPAVPQSIRSRLLVMLCRTRRQTELMLPY